MKQGSFTVKNITNYKVNKHTDNSDKLSKAKFELELDNGAKCSLDRCFGESVLKCTYSAESHNPFKQKVDDSSKDYIFTDEIRLEGIKLKEAPQIDCPADNPGKCSLNKLKFTFNDNGKVEYKAQYPTDSGTIGEVRTTTNSNGTSAVHVSKFTGRTDTEDIKKTNEGVFYFVNVEKGGYTSNNKI